MRRNRERVDGIRHGRVAGMCRKAPGDVNEAVWNRAKGEVSRDDYPEDDAYWSVVQTVYQAMMKSSAQKAARAGIIPKPVELWVPLPFFR